MRSLPATPDRIAERPGRRWILIGLGAWALATVGCSVFSDLGPRNGWADEWGPMVPHTTFPTECSLCHYPDRWDEVKGSFEFDHLAETGVPLNGAHAEAACLRCHNDRGPVEVYVARGCGGCHENPHESSMGLDCRACHDELSWGVQGLIADHAGTRFPLVGAHAFATCEACHPRSPQGEYRGAPVSCHQCHQIEAVTAFPNHVVNGWVRGCEDCHDTVDWRSRNFDHSIFPLVGGHAGADCGQCHVGGRIVGTPRDCFSCHRSDYLAAEDHVAENFSTRCEECHIVQDWETIIETTARSRSRR